MNWKMNRNFALVIIIMVLGLFSSASGAEEMIFDLNTAVELALTNNPRLQQMRRDSEIAHWNQRIALSTYLPHITAGFSAASIHSHPTLPYRENYQADLVLRQSMINFAQVADIKAASSGKRYQQENLHSYRQIVMFNCLQQFYHCLLAQDKLRLREKALSLAEEELRIAGTRYKEGLVSYYELLRSETKHLTASAELRKAEAEYRKSLNEFKNILGYKPEEKIVLKGQLVFKIKEIIPKHLSQEIDLYHPSLAAVDYLIEQREQGVSSSRAEFLPRLDLEVAHSAAKHYNVATAGDWNNHWSAYLTVSFPLFEGARRYSELQKSQQEYEKAELQKIELVNEIEKNIDSFYQDYASARDLMTSQEKNLQKSQELYELVRERYALGEASEIELLDAHLNLIATEASYKEATYQVIVSYYGILLSAGQLEKEALK
jgi:outer membrane protein